MVNGGSYFMEDPREKERLKEKVDPASWVSRYFAPEGSGAVDVLDVGCGPGVIAGEIGQAFPTKRVIGFDGSADRVSEAKRNVCGIGNVDIVQGDAHALPFPDASFDFVYSRFLVEYLRDKTLAIREMVRVLRPGGRLLLQDLDGQLMWHWPPDPILEGHLQRVLLALDKSGFDPLVGRKLFHLMLQAGCQDLRVNVEGYHLFPGRIDTKNEQLWELKLDIAMGVLRDSLGSEELARSAKQCFMDYLRREDTLTYSVVFTVVGNKKP